MSELFSWQRGLLTIKGKLYNLISGAWASRFDLLSQLRSIISSAAGSYMISVPVNYLMNLESNIIDRLPKVSDTLITRQEAYNIAKDRLIAKLTEGITSEQIEIVSNLQQRLDELISSVQLQAFSNFYDNLTGVFNITQEQGRDLLTTDWRAVIDWPTKNQILQTMSPQYAENEFYRIGNVIPEGIDLENEAREIIDAFGLELQQIYKEWRDQNLLYVCLTYDEIQDVIDEIIQRLRQKEYEITPWMQDVQEQLLNFQPIENRLNELADQLQPLYLSDIKNNLRTAYATQAQIKNYIDSKLQLVQPKMMVDIIDWPTIDDYRSNWCWQPGFPPQPPAMGANRLQIWYDFNYALNFNSLRAVSDYVTYNQNFKTEIWGSAPKWSNYATEARHSIDILNLELSYDNRISKLIDDYYLSIDEMLRQSLENGFIGEVEQKALNIIASIQDVLDILDGISGI